MLAKTAEPKNKARGLDKILNTVERIGNKVPHPSIIFLLFHLSN